VPSAGGLGDAFADEDDVIAPGDRIGGATESKGPKLRFCPESNDILYPKEDKQRRVLIYSCLSCSYEVSSASIWLVLVLSAHQVVRLVSQLLVAMYALNIQMGVGRCRPTEQRVWRMVCVQK